MAEKTKICCFGIEDKDIINYLKEQHEVAEGTLGTKVNLPNENVYRHPLRPNCKFPKGMHEYDVFIFDMRYQKAEDYNQDEFMPVYNEQSEINHLICESCVQVFNPIPLGAFYFHTLIHEDKHDKIPIIIVFQDKGVSIKYNWYDQDDRYLDSIEYSNYDFIYTQRKSDLYGKKIALVDNKESQLLFRDYQNGIEYHSQFYASEENGYIPLLRNANGDCISYIREQSDGLVIMLPQMNNKAGFLKHLFEDYLYEQYSDYFPYIEEHNWIHNEEYILPNENLLRNELEQAKKEYETKKAEIDARIEDNRGKYDFLHTLITATDAELVHAAIAYFHWLGFENVIDMDTVVKGDKEEDIQIDLGEDGLIVVEAKGIRGTSKDNECSQIEKIKHRREKDRQAFDVCALYVVNHQRGTEPIKRQNPPFTDNQISDAESDERGLLTTWQLYNLYFDIERGVIDKADAREALRRFGLVNFVPKNAVKIGEPYNEYTGNIICVELKGQKVERGDEMYAYDGRNWQKAEVLSIQENKIDVEMASYGKVGIKLSEELPKKVEVYVKHKEE